MKLSPTIRRVAACLTLLALLFALAVPVFAEIVYPTPTDYIADDAAVLSEQTVKQIKETNANLASEIKAVIAVCTVKSTNGIEIGKYARSLYSEWKLPTGILIVVASEDKSFFLVPSTGVSEVIDNTALEEVRDQYIEDDFAAGRIDTAIRKAVTQLSILMLREMKQDTAPAQSGNAPAQTPAATTETKTEDQGASVGSIIVGVLKAILIIALILLVLFVLLFIVALFNDDVAAIMQKYIFRRGNRTQNNAAYYDDRLYGDQNRNRQRQQNSRNHYDNNYNRYDDRNYGGQGYNTGNGGRTYQSRNPGGQTYQGQNYGGQQSRAQRQVRYDANGNPIRPQNAQRPRPENQGQTYYNADGTPRTQQQPRQQQNYYQANAQRARQQQYQANQAADATRAYTIPGRGNNAR
ncbi:MAG: TPM domain-containing protein [Clostridia bacterium]|nr:TPM domain-containing protein [Clostridia bacterium]